MVLILALVLVYAVMASQYESLKDPFIIMFSVPTAGLGVVLALYLTNTSFNLQAYLGVIMLGGIVVSNVILLGVHTNMCVLGRPFGLRQMAKNGKTVVLMRDMTDTMYNPRSAPFVSHFRGTELIIEHIEKFVCPTVTSDQVLGGKPFRFKNDDRK